MKYLSKYEAYKLYGNLQYSDVENLKIELEDILLELRDDGYNTEVKFSKDYKMHLFITFLDYQSKTAKWDDIKDYVKRINTVLYQFRPSGVYYKVMQPDGRVFNKNERDFIAWEDMDVLKFELEEEKYYPQKVKKLCFFSIEYIEITA